MKWFLFLAQFPHGLFPLMFVSKAKPDQARAALNVSDPKRTSEVHWVNGTLRRIAIKGTMDQHRHCKCGAIYRRTESMAPAREVNSFECSHCGETLESWNSAWVPSYRLVIGPIVKS